MFVTETGLPLDGKNGLFAHRFPAGWDSWMHVSLQLVTRHSFPQLCNRLHWTYQPAVFDACGVARLAALSRTKSSRPPDPFIPRQGKKGAKEKARFYWTSALLHRQLHIAPPIKLSLLASVTRAFFSLFFSFLP